MILNRFNIIEMQEKKYKKTDFVTFYTHEYSIE